MMGCWGAGNAGLGGMLLMMLAIGFGLLVLAAVAALAVWAISRSRRPEGIIPSGRGQSLAVLQERYARGEITREQYEQMRRDLIEL